MTNPRTGRFEHRFTAYRAVALFLVLVVAAFGLPAVEAHRDRASSGSSLSTVAFATCGSGALTTSTSQSAGTTGAVNADFQELVSPADPSAHTISYGGATVVVEPSAVKEPVMIGITELNATTLPPLDPAMTNVTGQPRSGFKFTPHPMRFATTVKVTLPWDPALMSPDFTAQEVYTYFYDDVAQCWQPLPRVSVDEAAHTVTSLTDHFTDMINATVVAPEHPENVSFNPNQIKGIQAADPGSNVNRIAAPQPGNTGSNQLAYPIEVPPGRLGLTPSLSVRYDSAGGNGWMGLGWNITTPAITVDTRWGVPRYADATETETYLLNGEQLTPVAHRGPPQARTAEKVFHTRVEGAFARIVRHGDNPRNYTWEVVDKAGTHTFYGGPNGEAILADDGGHGFEWAVREIRDSRGNFIRYRYATVDDTGVAPGADGGSQPGRDLYPTRITYTGNGTAEGPYSVEFIRDRDLPEDLRADKIIDARGGFKRVTADRLRRIDVKLNGGLIRGYDFAYASGAFAKTLLTTITQLDDRGAPFTHHDLAYFDEIRDGDGKYHAFEPAQWTVPGDGLGRGVLNLTDADAGNASALESSTSDSLGGHLYIGAGELPSKVNSVGIKVGGAHTSSDSVLALVDVDADGLPDKVFRTDSGQIRYRKNLSGPDGPLRFADEARPLPLPGIRSESSDSLTLGVEAYPGPAAAQLDFVTSFSTTSRYFSDVNSDGITDLVDGSSVLFGRIGPDGVPVYGVSADTPAPITAGQLDTAGLFGDFAADRDRLTDSFPLLDTVRRWIAPFDGAVRIEGPVRLAASTSAARAASANADGVRVAIQHEDTELWATDIGARDDTEHAPQGTGSVTVQRGDRIYFRLQSRGDGSLDEVSWDPQVTYLNVPSVSDVNSLSPYAYRASQDFTLGGRSTEVIAPLTGTLHLSGALEKAGPATDDVTMVVTRDGSTVFQQRVNGASTGSFPFDVDVSVQSGQKLRWRLQIDSPIDLGLLRWKPKAAYTAAQGVDRVTDPLGKPLIEVFPPYDVDMYPVDGLTAPQGSFSVTEDGELTVDPRLTFDFNGQHPSGRVVFTIKRRTGLVAKAAFQIRDGVVTSPGPLIVHEVLPPVPAGTDPVPDELFFDFSALDPQLRGFLVNQSVTVSFEGGTPQGAPSAFHSAVTEDAFPQPYRGWGAIGYNGNRDRATQPIAQADLVIDDRYADDLPEDVDPQADKDAFEADPRVDPPTAVPFAASPRDDRWAAGDQSWAARGGASSSRLGGGTIDLPRPSDLDGAVAVPRMSRTRQISLTGGVGGSVGSIGGSIATGDTDGQVDFLDLNGDGFPDVVGAGRIQYTDPTGGLGATRGSLPESAVRRSHNVAGNASAGSAARTIGSGRGDAAPRENTTTDTAEAGNDMPPLGVGLEMGGDESDVRFDLMDLNGDGLPDRVYADGQVALNLGYRFGAKESWRNPAAINDGSGTNAGLNLGFNTAFYGFAGGASYQEGRSSSTATLVDVNGDGLPDRVFAGTPIRVGLNTGNGFEAPVEFRGSLPALDGDDDAILNGDRNVRLGGGVYFTIPICIPFVACIIINPGGYGSVGASRSEQTLRDIDGDGFADHLSSLRDNQLVVAQNQTGKTNLLKEVKRPLGSTLTFDYDRDGNTYDQPQSRFVLSKVSVNDGQPGDGPDVQVVTYAYAGGVYDRLEREFDGYATVVTRQVDAGTPATGLPVITRTYRTDGHYTRGLVTGESTQDGTGRKFLETAYTYALRDVDDPDTAADPASPTATIFPHLVRTDKRFFEGAAAPGKTTFTTTAYDAFGNIVESFDAGEAGTADDVVAKVVFTGADAACRAGNIVGLAKQIDVFGGGTLMRHREAEVDCATGDVTRVTVKLNDTQTAVTDVDYFPNGNVRSVTGPANKTGQRFVLTYTYDDVTSTHVTSIVDSFGFRSTTAYNLKFGGAPETVTDENDKVVRTTYDSVGRITKVTGPHEAPDGATITFEYHPTATVPYAVTRHVDRQADGTVRADTIDTVKFVDGLDRTIQTKTDATVSTGPSTPPTDVMVVSGRVVFDAQGRTVRASFPVTEPKGPANLQFNPVFDAVQPAVTTYDVLGRPTRTVLPDDTTTTVAYGFGADRDGTTRFETVTTDANGKVKRAYVDFQQRITALREANPAGGQAVIWTSYRYDPLGKVTAVVDDHGSTTTAAYDLSGRRTTMVSPDAGRTDLVYDPAGNLVKKITDKLAAGQAIEYDFDFTRIKAIRYPVFTANNVTYTYGAPGAADNGANRITAMTDGAGTVTRKYGPLGEIVSETRTVTGQGNKTVAFTTQYRYDTWDRMLSMTYPDGEVLTYHYDSGGQVDSAAGTKDGFTYTYLQRLQYDKFGQRVLLDTGNGTHTEYTYDSQNRRLANLKANLSQGYVFQNLNYSYDAVGNVTSIKNDTVAPDGPDVGMQVGGPSIQNFRYDDLYQLVHADGSYQPRTPRTDKYSVDLQYDSVHNITRKEQRHELVSNGNTTIDGKLTYTNNYTYGARPHAALTIGIYTFAYDANGNQISREQQPGPKRQLIWDEENRLACSHENTQSQTLPQTPASCDNAGGTPNRARYRYDDQGNRIVKDAAQFHFYPNQNFSTDGNHAFKHVYIGQSKLLTKMVEPNRLEDRQFYSHADQLGSTAFVTSTEGGLAEHLQYLPGGETWVSEHPSQPVPQQFSGKELDPETNLYYFGARYYDPQTQLWQSPDPILNSYLDGSPAGGVFAPIHLAMYTYADNNPVTYTDPNGLWTWRGVFDAAVRGVTYALAGAVVVAGAVALFPAYAPAILATATAAGFIALTNSVSIVTTGQDLLGNKYTDDERVYAGVEAAAGLAAAGATAKLTRALTPREEAPPTRGTPTSNQKGEMGKGWSRDAAQARGWRVVGEEVDLVFTINGQEVGVRPDLVAIAPRANGGRGQLVYIEAKYSPAAPMTANQKIVIPALEQAGNQGLTARVKFNRGGFVKDQRINVVLQKDVWTGRPTLDPSSVPAPVQ